MSIELLREYVCLAERKRGLEVDLKSTGAQMDRLERAIVPQFLSDGVQSTRIDGRTLYIARNIEISPVVDRSAVVDALKLSGLHQYVAEGYNSQSLRAYVREIADLAEQRCHERNELFDEDEVRTQLPPRLAESLMVSFIHNLRIRRS